MKKNYLNNEYISDIVYHYIKYRKKENELVNIIKSIVTHLQLMPKFSGYSKCILDDMLQVSYFNFFNNIHNIKFSDKKKNKIIKVKPASFFQKYEKDNSNKELCGQKLYTCGIGEDRQSLITNKIVQIYNDISNESLSSANNLCLVNSFYKVRKIKTRLNATDFKEYYIVIDNSSEYIIDYNSIDFNYFSFITETIKSSFNQVLNKENEYKHANQVILWEMSDAYKFDVNNDNIKENIVSTIREVNNNFQKKRKR